MLKQHVSDLDESTDMIRQDALMEESTKTQTMNARRISFLCAQEWGLWRTVTGNLKRIVDLAAGCEQLTEEDVADITHKVGGLLERIEHQPKTLSWKLRSRIGESH
jgi:hypothetical protein